MKISRTVKKRCGMCKLFLEKCARACSNTKATENELSWLERSPHTREVSSSSLLFSTKKPESLGFQVFLYPYVQYRNILSVSILANISPMGSASIISIAEANHVDDAVSDIMPRLYTAR